MSQSSRRSRWRRHVSEPCHPRFLVKTPDEAVEVELPPPEPKLLRYELNNSTLAKIGGAILVVWLTIQIWPILVLLGLALMMAATFGPFVERLQSRLPRHWAIVLILVSIAAVVIGLLSILVPVLIEQLSNLITRLPQYSEDLQKVLAGYHIHVKLEKEVVSASNSLINQWPTLLKMFTEMLMATITAVVLTVYMLLESATLSTNFFRLLPRERRLEARRVVNAIAAQVGGYMRGQLITSLLAGLTAFTVLMILGVPEAFALACLTAASDAIPIIGLVLAVVPAALMALTISPGKAAVVVCVFLIYHLIENNLIAPRVYGKILGMSFTTIVVSFLIGGQLMGIVGALVALPVAAAIPSIFRFIIAWQGEEDEEGEKGPLPLPG